MCEGREQQTPLEIWADRPSGEANTPGWRVRSVPNLYPVLGEAAVLEEAEALDPERGERRGVTDAEGTQRRSAGDGAPAIPRVAAVAPAETAMSSSVDPLSASSRGAEPDLFASQPADGIHEVIVNTPRHEVSLAALSEAELAVAVAGWRERMRVASEDASYVHLIVNEGPAAGASLEHTHAQLYGLRFVPAEIARERERATAYHQRTMGSHMLGDVASQEVRRRDRLVAINDDSILIAPWASRSPFELRIVPRTPAPSFEQDGEVGAEMLARALRGLAGVFGALPQLNLWVRTAPSGSEEFCWHIDLVPRLTIRAGFELGTGVDINVYAPERAASDLREALA